MFYILYCYPFHPSNYLYYNFIQFNLLLLGLNKIYIGFNQGGGTPLRHGATTHICEGSDPFWPLWSTNLGWKCRVFNLALCFRWIFKNSVFSMLWWLSGARGVRNGWKSWADFAIHCALLQMSVFVMSEPPSRSAEGCEMPSTLHVCVSEKHHTSSLTTWFAYVAGTSTDSPAFAKQIPMALASSKTSKIQVGGTRKRLNKNIFTATGVRQCSYFGLMPPGLRQ